LGDVVVSEGVDVVTVDVSPETSFETFAAGPGERLRRALVARYGVDAGSDVCNDALAYAWQHWDRVAAMDNPVGYLYRVGQTAARRHLRWRRQPDLPAERPPGESSSMIDGDLGAALTSLNSMQRTCVVLVHVYDWTYDQTSTTLGISVDSVRNHLHRGMTRLRTLLEQP
jgi:RNA polymerase sigma factor (sigma-70 family)